MARQGNQKLKLLYLAKIFLEETDDEHALSRRQIIDKLGAYGITADRKTIYDDFQQLGQFGIDIITEQNGRDWTYHIGSRDFELPELKLLVDSVQSAKFITEKKSRELIKKLENLVSMHQAKELHRQVIIAGRVKTGNESIFYNVDTIHSAINSDKKIKFKYFQWNEKKEMVFRHDGAIYNISPWALIWDDENYYLVGFDDAAQKIKHYRVDKMKELVVTEDSREGKEEMKSFDLTKYSQRLFGMFGGDEVRVTFVAANEMAGILIDRFGDEIPMIKVDDSHFKTIIDVALSPQFYGWLFSLSPNIKVTSPPKVVEAVKAHATQILDQYK